MQTLQKFPSDKIYSFFFRELQLITVLLLIRLSESVFGIFHFQFRFVFVKVYHFVQQKTSSLSL